MPRRRQNATTLGYRPQRPVWKISFVHAKEVSEGEKKTSLVVGLLSWSQGAN